MAAGLDTLPRMALRLDLTGMFVDPPRGPGLNRAAYAAAKPRAARVRAEFLAAPPDWAALADDTGALAASRTRWQAVLAAGPPRELVVLGIGGSALGARALADALAPVHQAWGGNAAVPRLHVVDSVDPDWIAALLADLPLAACHFAVVSKSGGTLETAAQLLVFYHAVRRALGSDAAARARFTLVTDPGRGHFRALVDELGFASLPVPPGVGGRFSVLSAVGLFPAVALGLSVEDLLAGAARTRARLAAVEPAADAALAYALAHVLWLERGHGVHVHFPYSHRLRSLAEWYRQLWAESLGKRRDATGAEVFAGATPVSAVGPTDQHSQVQLFVEGPHDKVVTFVKVDRFGASVPVPPPFTDSPAFRHLDGRSLEELMDAERRGTEVALAEAGRPACALELCKVDAFHVGQYIQFLATATAYAGGLLGIDPYDQPGVEAGKAAALALMDCAGFATRAAEIRAREAAREPLVYSC